MSKHFESLEPRRLFNGGALDKYFEVGGTAATDFGEGTAAINDIVVMNDGRIVAGGFRSLPGIIPTRHFAFARYTVDGEVDESFSEDGKTIVDFGEDGGVGSIAVDSVGRIIGAGLDRRGGFSMVRLNFDGSIDESFGDGGSVFAAVGATGMHFARMILLADERIFIAGSDGSGRALTGLYTRDGKPDKTFSSGGFIATRITRGPANFEISSAAIDENGKIILCGTVDERDPLEQETFNRFGFVARLNPDGTLDSSFGGDGVVATRVEPGLESPRDLFIDADGNINVLVRANTQINIARFAFNGNQLDTIVNNTAVDAERFVQQSDQKLLVSNGKTALARIDPDGTSDQDFGEMGLASVTIQVNDITFSNDGGILVAGTSGDQFAIQRLWRSDAPAGTFEGRNRTRAGETAHRFQVTYRDEIGLDLTSIDNSDIEVVDPHGASIRAFLESKGITEGGQLLATYKIKPIGGRWDARDNGRYTVRIISNRVRDKAGNFIQGRKLGSFHVGIM